jgi:hypothetical protein
MTSLTNTTGTGQYNWNKGTSFHIATAPDRILLTSGGGANAGGADQAKNEAQIVFKVRLHA